MTAPRLQNELKVEWTVNYLRTNMYKFSAFVLDENGFPFSRTAIKPKSVSFSGTGVMKNSG